MLEQGHPFSRTKMRPSYKPLKTECVLVVVLRKDKSEWIMAVSLLSTVFSK